VIDLDPLDRTLLRALVADGTRTAASIARERALSPSLVARRMRRLEEGGAIRGRRVVLDRAALGFGVTVFLGVKLAGQGAREPRGFRARGHGDPRGADGAARAGAL
jgi:Lrp/AsnC family transcriptional regulator, leucine-responsive regulatory protein